MASVWWESERIPNFDCLRKDVHTDVLIIGGGLAGVLCAYMLRRVGVDYVLVEANRLCGGITKNTTAKITSQHGLIYDKLIREFGVVKAKMYLDANQAAVNKYRELCNGISCDLKNESAFAYSVDDAKKLTRELFALSKLGFDAKYVRDMPLPIETAGAVMFENQAQFNPIKFIAAIADGLNIYENTLVRELIGTVAVTDKGKIYAKRIVVATHFPFINKHGSYYLKLYQHRSYVIALENAQDVCGMYIDENDRGLSFRNYGKLLLLGGGSHRTGKQGGNWQELTAFQKRYYPNASEKYRWGTQDCMTLDGVPYIGNYSKNTPNLYVATGFNKWGMTSSMVAAMMLSDMLTDKKNQYAEMFSPSRTILRPQLAVNAFEATVNLLTIAPRRCPHLGCALKWNAAEHSWDCACHGSRFTKDGQLIDNPATGDLKQESGVHHE